MSLITVIGRGHSGTRAISQTLYASGVYMGEPLNRSADLLPPHQMYDACRVLARDVAWQGGTDWDFSRLHAMEIPERFISLVEGYLRTVLQDTSTHRGWKLPETTLVFPWIVRLFPEIKYIYWVRDPRDSIVGSHKTDDLRDFGIQYEPTENVRLRRAISWIYQYKIVNATPQPENWLVVRFEDFVLRQEEALQRLEDYLGMELARIPMRRDSVGRWKSAEGDTVFDFLQPALAEFGYLDE